MYVEKDLNDIVLKLSTSELPGFPTQGMTFSFLTENGVKKEIQQDNVAWVAYYKSEKSKNEIYYIAFCFHNKFYIMKFFGHRDKSCRYKIISQQARGQRRILLNIISRDKRPSYYICMGVVSVTIDNALYWMQCLSEHIHKMPLFYEIYNDIFPVFENETTKQNQIKFI